MEKIFELATSISTPIALAGLFGAIILFIMKQVISKDIFPRLSRELSSELIRHIIDKLFVLSIVAMILGFIGFSMEQVITYLKNEDTISVENDLVISGTIVDNLTNNAIPQASISIVGTGLTHASESNGNFHFKVKTNWGVGRP